MRAIKGGAVGYVAAIGMGLAALPLTAQAADDAAAWEVEELRRMIEAQQQVLDAQQRELEAQRRRLLVLETGTWDAEGEASEQPTSFRIGESGPELRVSGETLSGIRGAGSAQRQTAQNQAQSSEPEMVGEESAQREEGIEFAGLREVGGVLTPRGTVIFEPSLEFEHSSTNRFFFQGVEVADVVLVGQIEAVQAQRDTVTAATTFRYGLTDRSEVQVKIPYVYREQTTQTQVVGEENPNPERSLSGNNLGDIEVAGSYQLNKGTGSWPVFISNLRVKSNSGRGPYDVSYSDEGDPTELATGSGFWGVQPGITAVFPSDPAVFYGGISYLWHVEDDVDETVADSHIGKVDPGDVIGINLGMGLALNPRTSISFGYEHNFIDGTRTEVDGASYKSDSFQVGLASLGFSYALTDRTNLNFTLQTGVTEDAPDVIVGLRLPIAFQL